MSKKEVAIADTVSESDFQRNAELVAEKYGLWLRAMYIKTAPVEGWDDGLLHDHFFAVLERGRGQNKIAPDIGKLTMELRFHGSSVDAEKGTHQSPSIYDILACVQKSDPGTFESFCDEFGYDTDSRHAESVWGACSKEYQDFSHLFPEGIPLDILEIC